MLRHLSLDLRKREKKSSDISDLKVKWHGMAKTPICQNFIAKNKNDKDTQKRRLNFLPIYKSEVKVA